LAATAVAVLGLCLAGPVPQAAVNRSGCAGLPVSGPARQITVLTYHHILRSAENRLKNNPVVLDLERFEQQMDFLRKEGYYTITLQELEDFIGGKKDLPGKSVLLTFDDGYQSNYVYAYPVLKKYGFKACVFVITGKIKDRPEPFVPDRLTYLSREEMEMSRDVFEFASHTHAMHNITGKKADLLWQPGNEIKSDLQKSAEALHTKYFSYPYGQYNERVIAILKETGFRMAFTTQNGKVRKGDNPFKLKRYGISPYITLKRFQEYLK